MKLSKKEYGIENCFLSKNCIQEWLPAIENNKKIYEAKKGELIFKEGDVVEGIYFVYTGCIKVHKQWGSDKELILRFATDSAILGHRGLSTKNKHYPISATALSDCVLCYITLDFFNSTLRINPTFHYKFLMFFADELQESERKMRNLAHMSVKGRLAMALEYFIDEFGLGKNNTLKISFSKQDIASYIGTTYETLFRTINEMADEKAIEVVKKEFIILDQEKLKSYFKE